MRKSFVAFLFLCIGISAKSQEGLEVKLPSVLPPTPEPAAIVKQGQLAAGLYTGAAQASIPLYTINVGEVAVPISLSYTSNGTRVDDIPSRAGLGWVLNASGVVTRIVRGAPDDKAPRIKVPTAPSSFNQSNFNYYVGITTSDGGNSTYDSEPDEFSYSAPGISGRFVLDDSGRVVSIPYSANKIYVYGGGGAFNFTGFKIISLEGNTYEFGTDAIESTTSHTNISGMGGHQTVNTSFFLRKITMHTGETIEFNYGTINTTSATGVSQSITLQNGGIVQCSQVGGCPTNAYGTLSTKVSLVNYSTKYLTSIQSSDGTYVSLGYAFRPDYSGDNRVTSLTILNGSTTLKKYVFNYTDPTTFSGVGGNPGASFNTNKRFFLSSLMELGRPTVTQNDSLIYSDTLKYQFDYNDINGLPVRLSYSQDHFGFYNGKGNSWLLPPTGDNLTWGGYTAGVDRSSDWSFASKGMLTKVTYPTGGYESYEYEGNTVPGSQQQYPNPYVTVSVSGTGFNTSDVGTWTVNFLAKKTQTTNINIESKFNQYYWESISQTPPANDPSKPVEFFLKNLTNNTTVYYSKPIVNNTLTASVNLVAGNNYQIMVKVTGQAYYGNAYLAHDTLTVSNASMVVNAPASGVRVKSIVSYDPVTNKQFRKYYKYGYRTNPDSTSGIGALRISGATYVTNSITATSCGTNCLGCYNFCNNKTLSSSSSIPLYAYGSDIVVYKSVIETDDTAFVNGGTEHRFELPTEYASANLVLNDGIKGLPANTNTNNGGVESLTTVFNSSKAIVKQVEKRFKFDSLYIVVPAISARRNYFYNPTLPYSDDDFAQFDASQYYWLSMWIQPDSVITREYDANGTVLTNYSLDSFGLKENTYPVKTETMGSDGKKTAVYMKYPNHFASTYPYNRMVSGNYMSPVIEKRVYVDGRQVVLSKTNYVGFTTGGTDTLYAPQNIETKKADLAQESRLRFYKYFKFKRPGELSKENDIRVSYIWDSTFSNPIAQFTNASLSNDSIAYTSFEDGQKGYWNYSGTPTGDISAPTGIKVYNLSGGALSRSTTTGRNYVLTFWLKNGSGTPTVGAATGKAILSKYGWTCYQYDLVETNSVGISGTGIIDEVRLYPQLAQVTSYTYQKGVGITSASGPDNNLGRFEYDAFNRLSIVRDGDRNVLKKNEYKLNQNYTPCASTTANWVSQGVEQCVQSGPNNNYTGQRIRLEKDVNPCSATYLQTRWLNIGTSGCTATNCTGTNYRIPTGGSTCVQGQMVFVYQTWMGSYWECKYYYYWPQDGYRTQDYISNDINICSVN